MHHHAWTGFLYTGSCSLAGLQLGGTLEYVYMCVYVHVFVLGLTLCPLTI